MLDFTNAQTALMGYVPSSLISFMHLQDFIMAFLLGFVGTAGAFVFKSLVEYLKKD